MLAHATCLHRPQNHHSSIRLLEIVGVHYQTCVKLCENMDQSTSAKYVALSHCWGDGKILKLTAETFHALKSGFLMADLSQRFQDAILISFRLGFKYIWIDSLCIFQDSQQDWNIQAPQMASVYGNAEITIAALKDNDQMSSFSWRDPLSLRPCRLFEHAGRSVYAIGHSVGLEMAVYLRKLHYFNAHGSVKSACCPGVSSTLEHRS